MIVVVAPTQETWEIEEYLAQNGSPLRNRLRILTYDEIAARQELPLGTYVFVAIDQLLPTLRNRLPCGAASGCREADPQLEDHQSAIGGAFAVSPSTGPASNEPAIIFGSTAPPRPSAAKTFPFSSPRIGPQRQRQADCFIPPPRWPVYCRKVLRGFRLRDLIVVEYCDTMDPADFFGNTQLSS